MRKFRLLVPALVIIILLALPMGASAESAQTAGGSGCAQWYTIKWGDTLTKIAVAKDTTVAKLVELNSIQDPNFIIAGATLCVAAKPPVTGIDYTVKKGDTLGNIAWKYGWTALYLASINNVKNPDLIYPGQVLWIPAH